MVPSHSQRTTRQTKIWYQLGMGQPSTPEAMELVPATLTYDDQYEPTKFYVNSSMSCIPPESVPSPGASYSTIESPLQALDDMPEFYQRMLGPLPSMADQATLSIVHGMELETLVACSDGSYDPMTKRGSHGWLFANEGHQDPLFQGAGPDDCHTTLMSSY